MRDDAVSAELWLGGDSTVRRLGTPFRSVRTGTTGPCRCRASSCDAARNSRGSGTLHETEDNGLLKRTLDVSASIERTFVADVALVGQVAVRAFVSAKRVERGERLVTLGALVLVGALVFVHHLVQQQTASERKRLVARTAGVLVLASLLLDRCHFFFLSKKYHLESIEQRTRVLPHL